MSSLFFQGIRGPLIGTFSSGFLQEDVSSQFQVAEETKDPALYFHLALILLKKPELQDKISVGVVALLQAAVHLKVSEELVQEHAKTVLSTLLFCYEHFLIDGSPSSIHILRVLAEETKDAKAFFVLGRWLLFFESEGEGTLYLLDAKTILELQIGKSACRGEEDERRLHSERLYYLIEVEHLLGLQKASYTPEDYVLSLEKAVLFDDANPKLLFRLSQCYFYGYGVTKNLKQAIYYAEDAMKHDRAAEVPSLYFYVQKALKIDPKVEEGSTAYDLLSSADFYDSLDVSHIRAQFQKASQEAAYLFQNGKIVEFIEKEFFFGAYKEALLRRFDLEGIREMGLYYIQTGRYERGIELLIKVAEKTGAAVQVKAMVDLLTLYYESFENEAPSEKIQEAFRKGYFDFWSRFQKEIKEEGVLEGIVYEDEEDIEEWIDEAKKETGRAVLKMVSIFSDKYLVGEAIFATLNRYVKIIQSSG